MASNINVTADVSDAIDAFNKYNTTLANLNQRINEVTKSQLVFDGAGNVLSGTISGLTQTNDKFIASLGITKNGLEVAEIAYTKITKSIAQMAEEQAKAAAQAQKLADAQAAAAKKVADQQQAAADKVAAAQAKANDALRDAADASSSFSRQLQLISNLAERFVLYRVFDTITNSIKEGVKAARDYQVEISLIRTISQDNQLSTSQWAKGLKDVSDQLGLPLAEVAKSAYDAVSNQVVSGTKTFQFLKDAGDLARTTGGSIKDSVNTLSTVINSYNLNATDAAKISAILFNTIDEGRVKLDDLANSLGPIVSIGKGLGVELTDITGSLAFLTQKGVSSAQALTFMRNVFVQLEKPSNELKELFKEIGVNSGEAAIKTFGFTGVLDKINSAVKGGNASVAGLFPEIRANQPIQAALNDTANFERIIKQQEQLTTLTQTYQNAIEIRGESPADYINKEFNKLKNTFSTDIGTKLNDLIKDFLVFESSGKSLSETVSDLVIRLRNIVIVFGAFRTTLVLTRTGMLLYAASATQAAGATATVTSAGITASATLRAIPFALVASGIALVATKLLFTNDVLDNTNEALNVFDDRIKKIKQTNSQGGSLVGPAQEDLGASLIRDLESTSRSALQILANVNTKNQEVLDKVRANNKDLTSELANSFGTFSNSLKDKLRELEKTGHDAQSVLDGLSKSALSFSEKIEESLTSKKLSFATDTQAYKLLGQEIDKQSAKAKDLSLTGNPDDAKEALKIVDNILKLKTQQLDKVVDLAKNNNLDYARDYKGILDINRSAFGNAYDTGQAPEFERRGNAMTVDVNKLYGTAFNEIKKQELQIQENIRKSVGQTLETSKQQIAVGKERIKNLDEAFKKFNDFSIFDTKGKVKTEFTDPLSGKIDEKKVNDALNKSVDKLEEFGGTDINAALNIQKQIADRRKAIFIEAELAIRQARIETAQQSIGIVEAELKKQSENTTNKIKDALEKNKQFVQQAKDDANALGVVGPAGIKANANETGSALAQLLNQGINSIGGRFTNKRLDENIQIGNPDELKVARGKDSQLKTEIDIYNKLLDRLQSNGENRSGTIIPRTEDLNYAQQALDNILKTVKAISNTAEGDRDTPKAILGGKSFNDIQQAAQEPLSNLRKNAEDLSGLTADQIIQQQQFKFGTKKAITGLEENFTPKELGIAKQIEAQLNNTTALQRLTVSINNIGKLPVVPIGPARPDGVQKLADSITDGELPVIPIGPGRAEGGWIGGVSGPDKNLTPTTRGEFVVNATQAAEYSDVLQAINSGRGQYVVNGGNSNVTSTRVGDVVINMNVQHQSDVDPVKLGNVMNRAIKRGLIKLN